MKKAIIYYFSGTGNTLKAVNLYKDTFIKEGIDVTLYEIKYPLKLDVDINADLIGFAYPIHAFNAPKIMLDFIKAFPKCKGKKYFIIKTSGEPLKLNNISSLYFKDILSLKGYKLTNEYHYAMPYNMIFRHTELMAYKMGEALKYIAPIDAMDIVNGVDHKLSRVPFGRLIAFIFRIEHIAMNINGKFFKVDKDKCIGCKKCEINCPTNNIIIKEDGTFKFKNNCLMCTKCSFNCPKDAFKIALLNNWRVNGSYSFVKPEKVEEDKHSWYCKRAYARYFKEAEVKSGGKFTI